MSVGQIHEPLAPGLTRVWELEKIVWEGDTPFQHVVIAQTDQGVSLFSDNDRQSTELSQLVYHEALMVPALLLADQVRSVLVVGSSEGVVCQMAVAAGAARVDHVDIDEQAVKLCAEHLPYGYTLAELGRAERGDGPVKVRYEDGWQFLRDAAAGTDRYDIVLVDLPDERPDDADAQINRLYGAEFLSMCKAVLAPGGVVVNQSGCPTLWRNETLKTSWSRFNEVFATVAYYGSDEHEWAYLFGRAEQVENPTELMVSRLAACGYRPVSIDAEALRSNATPPYHVRREV
ncbi:MAG: spermidine synthase [Segniliparus sp.]|uniref:spermidine synthase n=1 Tax=Segniliparus sp. TaxID=2804064 RepID=UPI003F34ED7F